MDNHKVIEHQDDVTTTPAEVGTDLATASPEPDLAVDAATAGRWVAVATWLEAQAAQMKAAARGKYSQHLARLYQDTKSKSFNILLDGHKVATATVPEAKDETKIAMPNAFMEWVSAHPEWKDEIEVIRQVRPSFEKRILKDVHWVIFDPNEPEAPVVSDDPWADVTERFPESRYIDGDIALRAVHKETGELIPGLVFVPGRVKVETFRFLFDKPKAGAAQTDLNQRTGAEIVADFVAEHGYESFLRELVSSGTLELES